MLMHTDSLVCIALVSFFLYFIALFCGSPQGKSRMPFLNGKPILTLLFVTPLITFLLVFAPTLITDLVMQYRPPVFGSRHLFQLPNPGYVKQAVVISFFLSLFFADVNADKDAVRWWSIPFLFFPAPLLWWNFLIGWLPSKWWSVWRPVLLALTFAPLLFSFPSNQPIRNGFPRFSSSNTSEIKINEAYQVTAIPGKPEAYINGMNKFCHVGRTDTGHWEILREHVFPFLFDEATFDFPNNTAYIFDGVGRSLIVFDLTTFTVRKQHPIPIEMFPSMKTEFKQAFDPDQRLLALMGRKGNFATIDLNTFQGQSRLFFHNYGDNAGIGYDSDSGILYILSYLKLYAYRISDMTLIASIPFDSVAGGLVLDKDRNRVLVSFPTKMNIVAYDMQTLTLLQKSSAPMSARMMAIDSIHRLLIVVAMNGVIEIRDADTLERKDRYRVISWVHGLAVLPETGDMILAPAHNYVHVCNYLKSSSNLDLGDFAVQVAEILLKRLSEHGLIGLMRHRPDTIPGGDPEISAKQSKRVLVLEANPFHEKAVRSILEIAGYDTVSTASEPEAKRLLQNKDNLFDLIILDYSFTQENDKNLEKMIRKIWPDVPIVKSMNPQIYGEPVPNLMLRKPYLPRQVLKRLDYTWNEINPEKNH